MSAHEAIRKAVDSVITDTAQAAKVSDAVFVALDTAGWFTTDSDHLAMMRTLLQHNYSLATNPETNARDVAALTNKVQSLSKEVATLEERARQESRQNRGRNSAGGTADEKFDPDKV